MAGEKLILSGRYQVIGTIDCGTLAELRLAFDTVLQRKVSVKLAADVIGEAGGRRPDTGLFKREAEMAASLQHPHLLPVYDYGNDGDQHYLVTRVFNETLRDLIRVRFPPTQPMPLDVALPLFQNIAGAIDYLHEHGPVIHGNLKPHNIVLDTESKSQIHPFISDFGVAALGPRVAGTPVYMAPEQASVGDISPAVDLFAFGLIVYECLTGTSPFRGKNLETITASKMQPHDGQYSVCRVRPEVPVGVDVVIAGLTRPSPSERYVSASAAIEEMARSLYSAQSSIVGTVFLSYAREESVYVHDLARRLRSLGIKLWIDQDIEPGTSWDRSVEVALQQASSMLVIMSPAAVQSETVSDEWSYFLDSGKAVLPAIYESCELPLRLRRRQHIRLNKDMLSDVARIVDALTRSHGGGGPATPDSPRVE